MPRSFWIDFGDNCARTFLICGLIVMDLCGSASAEAPALACSTPQRPMRQIELLFGRNIGKRLGVGEAAWSRFVAREITPRFPDGLAILDANGQWRDKERGRLVREPSKLVVIVTAEVASVDHKIESIVAAYRQQFSQRSVGVISQPVCAAF